MAETLITGRIVGGHPMRQNEVRDQRTNAPKMRADGITPRKQVYVGVAIRKGNETHWNQTEWGQVLWSVASQAFPAAVNSKEFAFKITDGDSSESNKRGTIPNQKEGYAGHWILNASTELAPPRCFHAGKLAPHEVIQDANAIKAGDYIRMLVSFKGNENNESPGIYVNPELVELIRAGQEIVLESGPSAADVFAQPAQLPPGALVDQNVPAAAAASTAPPPPVAQAAAVQTAAPPPVAAATAPPPPAHDFAEGPKMYTYQGQQYTKEQLLSFGWNEQQIAALV